ncbi:protein FAR1-RELATED SEQUENCE 5-like [Cynara cardunculus var. scolymus]|uniref:protein FAR1-RELATED SEQUENCE 5-like n=1 Tax=Cynara cardunculus var. scolymus TaxID=59895 RepID=UPI000D630459|nr:protein FAR1-RELATED SEQUENCE 5-like [Cynara cardunculus var. scolymus]
MDYMSFNETFSKDIVEESSVFDSMNDCQGFDYGGENATAVNDETIEDQCNYSMRNEDGCNDRNETLCEHNDGVFVDFVDDDVASLSNESEEYRFDGMGETSDGSKCWFPNIDSKHKPKVGDGFETVESAEKMYQKYANEAGFDVRLSNKKINKIGRITSRFYVCSKKGRPPSKYFDSLDVLPGDRRIRNSNVKCSGCGACFKIHYVKERRLYEVYKFIEQHNHMLFNKEEMRFSRSKRQLHYGDHKNVFHGSSSKVGVTKSHRFRAITGDVDCSGGTVRDHQNCKRDMAYFVGNEEAQMLLNVMSNRRKELLAIFWADETARSNYREFGDAISFDATFRMNKHAMIFVLFVAIDNHKKSVVVGATLIHNESVVDYTWVLKAFVKADGRQPRFVITDQCASMKQAILIAFPESKHRLCMWHITKKLKSKNVHLAPDEFEMKWNNMMDLYGLRGDSWFDELYEIRESWIPAYYKDYHMSGLMKTTSSQWTTHGLLEVTTKSTVPRLVSPCKLEAYAVEVVKNKMENSYECSCNCFVRNGILCRHALKVMLNDEVDRIPYRYILRHWRRDLVPVEWLPARFRYGEVDADKESLMSVAYSYFERILGRVQKEKHILSKFVDQLQEWDTKIDSELPLQSHTQETTTSIKEFLGVSQPENIDVLPPTGIRNKGCGTSKRLISAA